MVGASFEYSIDPGSKGGVAYYRWYKLLTYALVLIGFVTGTYFIFSEYSLQKRGILTEAVVIGYKTIERMNDNRLEKSYLARFKFTDIKSQTIEVSNQWTSSSPYWRIGSKVSIVYDPKDPQVFRVDDFYHTYGLGVFLVTFMLAFFVFSRMFFWFVDSRGLIGQQSNPVEKEIIR
jgi:hypothetical protein